MSVYSNYNVYIMPIALLVLIYTYIHIVKPHQLRIVKVPRIVFTAPPVVKEPPVHTSVYRITNTTSKRICQHNNNTAVNVHLTPSIETLEDIEMMLKKTVLLGGKYEPNRSTIKGRLAVIIPFRDREEHLMIFLRHMHPFLQRQRLRYTIFVIEMDRNLKFNRAILMNIGFVEAMKLANYKCFVFHDVDLLPEDHRVPYSCAKMPKHMSVAVDKFNYTLPYTRLFGGACSITTKHFRKLNGFSNMFFGWGGEDDDMRERIRLHNLKVVRPSVCLARYKMIFHTKDLDKNTDRFCLLNSTKLRMHEDGISNLKYRVKAFELRSLYTWVLVQVNETYYLLSKFIEGCRNDTKITNLDKRVEFNQNSGA